MMQKYSHLISFLLVFLLGLAMRSPEILAGNYLFGFDQGQNYIAATNIANGKFTLIGAEVGSGAAGVPGLFHGPGFYYILAGVIKLFGPDPYWGLVLMWIGGVATMLLVYLTARMTLGKTAALFALFLVSIAPLIAPQSRFMWGPHLGTILIVLVYGCIYLLPKKPLFAVFWGTFFAGLLYHFELAIAVPLVITVFLSLFVYKVFSVKTVLVCVLAFCLAFAPAILFEVRHDFMATRGIVKHITNPSVVKQDQQKQEEESKPHSHFLSQHATMFVVNLMDSFVFDFGLIRPQHYPLARIGILAVMLFGIIKAKNAHVRKYLFSLCLVIPITFLVFVPLKNYIWHYYLIHQYFVYILLFSYGVFVVFDSLPKNNGMKILSICLSLWIVFFILSMSIGVKERLRLNWEVDFPDYGGREKILGKKYIIDRVYKEAAGKPFSLHIFVPQVYTHPYEYLLQTYALPKYGYLPSREKTGTGYMIVEIDGSKPWSYKGWLETVIVTGTPVWEVYVKQSDHILQKRIFTQE